MQQYNAAQMVLINLGGTAALAVQSAYVQPVGSAPATKKVRKVRYGDVLKAHFDRVNLRKLLLK